MGSTSLPTEVQMRQATEVKAGLAKAIEQVNAAIARASSVYQELAKSGVYPALPKPIRAIATSSQ
jgi:hypothetical protein